jgi:hypothetical protein
MLCLERPSVPVFQNVRYPTRQAAKQAATGRLAITECGRCGFVFNAAFDPRLAVYSADYENEQALSERFRGYLDGIAARVLGAVGGERQPVVLEIGCGQASFLKQIAGMPAARFSRFLGFDPAWRGGDTPNQVDVRPRLFDIAVAVELGASIDAVISRHVIEHVAEPVQFLKDIRRAIDASPRPTVMLETPCLEWIIDNDVLFDFFYEHCCYFTIDTLCYALRRAGYHVLGSEHVFDGQYLWAEAEPVAGRIEPAAPPAPLGLGERIRRLGERGAARVATWRDLLLEQRKHGLVALWGAGAKGATLAALIDPAAGLIDCLIDINPRKQGGFIAGTGHPVVSPDDAAARGVRVVLPMNPNYRDEITRLIRDRGLGFRVVEEI